MHLLVIVMPQQYKEIMKKAIGKMGSRQ